MISFLQRQSLDDAETRTCCRSDEPSRSRALRGRDPASQVPSLTPLAWLAGLGALAGLLLAGPVAADPFADGLPENAVLKSVLEQPTISGIVRLSPQGTRILFRVEEKDVETNADLGRWMVARIENGALSDMQPFKRRLDRSWLTRWLDETTFAYFLAAETDGRAAGLRTLNVETGEDTLVLAADALGEGVSMPGDFSWRDDGGAVAVRGLWESDANVEPGGVTYDAYAAGAVGSAALYVYDVEAETVRQVTPDSYYAARTFGWSPSGTEIAFAYETRPDVNANSIEMLTDLAVLSLADGAVRPLVTQTGGESHPVWSPDGEAIAIRSHRGKPVYAGGWGAVVDPGGEAIRYVAPSQHGHVHRHWSPDGTWYVASEAAGFSRKLMRVDAASGAAVEIEGLDRRLERIETLSSFFFAEDGSFVFVKSNPATPPELYWSKLSADGRRVEPPKRLTDFGADAAYDEVYDYRLVEWRSADDVFDLAGVLVTPKGAREPLPTIVNIIGGPTHVRAQFSDSAWPGMVNAAAAAGYAVFTPTTRGRAGFGDAFNEAIGSQGSGLAKPWSDAHSGLKHLIETGIADPERLAVIGHSYGGAMAAYAITQTDFAAAVVHEPGDIDRTAYIRVRGIDGWRAHLSRDFFGVRDRFDDAEQAMVIHESALWQADQINTPTLLHCGLSGLRGNCDSLIFALRELGTPSEYFIYEEDHTFSAPIAQYNDVLRTLAWIDYWTERTAEW